MREHLFGKILIRRDDKWRERREFIRLLDTSARRGMIKQWDRGESGQILKKKRETERGRGEREGEEDETNKRRALLATYVSTFVSRGEARRQNQSRWMTSR